MQNTRHLKSVDPVAMSWLFGCHATQSTVERCCLIIFEIHQSLSASKRQTGTHFAPLVTANFWPSGLHRTCSAARLIRRITSDGFQCPSGCKFHTNALRSCEHVTILFCCDQSMDDTSMSCCKVETGVWKVGR